MEPIIKFIKKYHILEVVAIAISAFALVISCKSTGIANHANYIAENSNNISQEANQISLKAFDVNSKLISHDIVTKAFDQLDTGIRDLVMNKIKNKQYIQDRTVNYTCGFYL